MKVDCPKCRGTGFVTLQNEAYRDPDCPMCLGQKHVDTDKQCWCGRPAVRVYKDEEICGDKTCTDRMDNGGKKAKTYVC